MAETADKWILILGAGSDIARALAHEYARAGWNCYLAGRRADRFTADVSDLQIRYGVQARVLAFDAEDFGSHGDAIGGLAPFPEAACVAFGYLGDQQRAQQDWQEAQRILAVNYNGAVSALHHIARRMETTGRGTIIGISSVAGERGRGNNYYYGSAKAGFTAFLSGLRNQLYAAGVHVLTVKPGYVRTAMTEGLALPPLITATPQQVARDIFRAAARMRNSLYTLWVWRYIMLIFRNIPEGIFKRMRI